jgi:purine-nucleoside phosphorylase
MVISDHINMTGQNPLAGPNVDALGPRFPDMTGVYDRNLRHEAREAAEAEGIEVKEGVYAAMPGPSYETPAEVEMLRRLGADAVGMSTVPEAVAARHAGVKVLGFSLISNMAAGLSKRELTHRDVLDAVEKASVKLKSIVRRVVSNIEDHIS